jgi:pyridoxal biosynthesis lyase PdxS
VQFDLEKTGGRNPLSDLAAEISIRAPAKSPEDDELDRMRGESTGYVTHEEGMRQMRKAAGGSATPSRATDTLTVDADGNATGSTLTSEVAPEEQAAADANAPGSFEAFMLAFGGGGTPPPRGPIPS